MQLYDIKVKLTSQNHNVALTEVQRKAVTAAEVLVLRRKHGAERVVIMSKGKMDKRSHSVERTRLGATYGEELIEQLFGQSFTKLPVVLSADELETDEDEDEDLEALEEATRPNVEAA